MVALDKTQDKLKTLIAEDILQKRVKEIAQTINKDFKKTETLYVICILKGSIMFTADLIKHLDMPVQVEFVRLSSYGDGEKSSGKVKAVDLTLPNLSGKNVVVIEDIVDTGLTAKFFLDYIMDQHEAKTVKFAALLDKVCARENRVQIDYAGFQVDDKFVVGYGLDYKGFYRNLPYIGYFPN